MADRFSARRDKISGSRYSILRIYYPPDKIYGGYNIRTRILCTKENNCPLDKIYGGIKYNVTMECINQNW